MAKKLVQKLKLTFIPCPENKYRPESLSGQFLLCYLVFLFLLKLTIIPFSVYFPESAFFADLTKIDLIEFTNKSRDSLGLATLKENPKLNEAAFLKANDMLEKDYFAHNSPEGVTPWSFIKGVGYNYRFAGENLAICFLDSSEVHQAWMDSPSHQKNILNPNYKEIGIAVIKGIFQDKETTLVVQMFGSAESQLVEEKEPIQIVEPEEQEEQEDSSEELATTKEFLSEKTSEPPEEVVSAFTNKEIEGGPRFNFFKFMSTNYYNLTQGIIYGSLIFIILSLLLTVYFDIFIYRKFEIQYKDIVLKTVGFSLILLILLLIDKPQLIQIIPHNFNIY